MVKLGMCVSMFCSLSSITTNIITLNSDNSKSCSELGLVMIAIIVLQCITCSISLCSTILVWRSSFHSREISTQFNNPQDRPLPQIPHSGIFDVSQLLEGGRTLRAPAPPRTHPRTNRRSHSRRSISQNRFGHDSVLLSTLVKIL